MEKFKKRNKILVVISSLILIILALLISKATYSFLEPVDPDDVIINSEITATGDTLLFTKGTDIDVVLSQDNFNSESGNLVRSVTPQVKLIASNKTNNATADYYVSVNISENTFQYTNGTSNPEILLTVTDNEGNPLTSCTGLTYTTVGGVSGFDITNKMGVYDFAEQTISTTSSTAGTTHNWTYTVTFINKETDQSINEDAKISIQAILHKESEDFCELNPENGGCNFTLSYNPVVTRNITSGDGTIYYHDATLENGANDGSYRYAGVNPNNYICFGSVAATCPAENIYRIIGLIPVDVVIDDTNPNNIITEKQMLYKIVKNDYATSTELGMTSPGNADKRTSFDGPTGNLPSGNVEGFYWSGDANVVKNTWSLSSLNTTGLNTNFINNLGSAWSSKIANVMWKVGGNTDDYLIEDYPIFGTYYWEITQSGIIPSNYVGDYLVVPEDNKNEIPNKVGLMYISDYGYASSQNVWNLQLNNESGEYHDIRVVDWLYKGVYEWLITRVYNSNKRAFFISKYGESGFHTIYSNIFAVRPTFYLTEDTEIDMTNHAGTLADPYRIKMDYVYWNDNFGSRYFTRGQIPTGTGLNGTYDSRLALETAFGSSNFAVAPFYIKTVILSNSAGDNSLCLYYNNHEFCYMPNYWDTDAVTTKTKFKNDLETQLGITIPDVNFITSSTSVSCEFGNYSCMVSSNNDIGCSNSSGRYCNINTIGTVYCAID